MSFDDKLFQTCSHLISPLHLRSMSALFLLNPGHGRPWQSRTSVTVRDSPWPPAILHDYHVSENVSEYFFAVLEPETHPNRTGHLNLVSLGYVFKQFYVELLNSRDQENIVFSDFGFCSYGFSQGYPAGNLAGPLLAIFWAWSHMSKFWLKVTDDNGRHGR